MAIEFVAVEGSCVPLIVCDHCNARIRNGDGTVFYRFHSENRLELDGPHFLHKECSLVFERAHQDTDEMWLSDEMDVWLGYLVRSAGYELDTVAGRVRVFDILEGRE